MHDNKLWLQIATNDINQNQPPFNTHIPQCCLFSRFLFVFSFFWCSVLSILTTKTMNKQQKHCSMWNEWEMWKLTSSSTRSILLIRALRPTIPTRSITPCTISITGLNCSLRSTPSSSRIACHEIKKGVENCVFVLKCGPTISGTKVHNN